MHARQSRMVAVATLLAFTAVANGAAHLQPYNLENGQPQLAERAIVQRDFFSDLSSFFSSLLANSTPKTTTSASAASSKATTTSASAATSKPASTSAIVTLPASSGKPSSPSAVGTASGSLPVSSAKPASSTGTVASSVKPASSSKPASSAVASGTGTKTSTATTSSSSSSSSSTSSSIIISSSASLAQSSTTVSLTGPTASAPAGTFLGTSYNGIDQFINIPYAQPPVGPLRFKPPQPLTTSLGTYSATSPPNACPQYAQELTGNYSAGGLQPLFDKFIYAPTNQSEDCLTVNVFRPNTTTAGSKLPVVFWIFGGGFQFGSTSMYNGTNFVRRSVSLSAPVIFVEVNYRLGGFGFLHGADLAAEHSTNLGLRDQRLGLQWVADNIESFGGDSSKVVLWGESAGSISSAYQLVVQRGDNTYKGKPLFRGSIHDSGSFAPADNGTAPQAQAIYDSIVSQVGCSASTAAARLSCLRSVDYEKLHNATNSVPGFGTYRSADLPYLPRTDDSDTFYNFSTEYAVPAGYWTKTPFIIGDQEDEGTLLAIVQNNITTNDDLVTYLASWFPNNANAVSDVSGLAALYPDDPSGGQPDGSPFGTGSDNNLYPEYKRLAAILGDIVFTITRRAFLNFGTGQGVQGWSYLAVYLRGLATFGTLHASDLAYLFDDGFYGSFATRAIQTHYVSFVNSLDPNKISSADTTTVWPSWNSTTPQLAYFGAGDTQIGNDTFRSNVYDYLVSHVFGFKV